MTSLSDLDKKTFKNYILEELAACVPQPTTAVAELRKFLQNPWSISLFEGIQGRARCWRPHAEGAEEYCHGNVKNRPDKAETIANTVQF